VTEVRVAYVNKVRMDESLPAVNFTLFNAIGLAEAGAETLLYVQKKKAGFSENDLFSRFDCRPPEQLNLILLPEKRILGIKTNQWFYLSVFRSLRKENQKKNLTAVISRDPGALPYLVRFRKKTGVPVFYQPHNFYLDLSLQPDLNPKNARKYHLLESRYLKHLTGLLCLQDSQAAWYRKFLPGLPVYAAMPGLVRLHEARSLQTDEVPVIGYSGSLQLKKGMETLLKAASRLVQNQIAFRLLLIGGRNEAEISPVRELVRNLDLEKVVVITGWIPFSEVEQHLRTLSAGVIPLTNAFYNRYLTAPNKFFDYLSMGIPVVASDLPAVRDFMTDGREGFLVPPENEEALAVALTRLITDQDLNRRFRNSARETAGNFLWKKRGLAMLGYIREAAIQN